MRTHRPVRLLAATMISSATLALSATPASAAAHHLSGRQALAAPNPVCLDATNNRANGTNPHLYRCANHPNQQWVIHNGQIKVEDTLS
ncbi:hypothetical protein [Nonomuraea sp. GTA35]|uniref:hypothetical protein n=1 Tax=Nonomuraea sp. GTA35 TaxID=1676746 RepID=UPI0035C140E7